MGAPLLSARLTPGPAQLRAVPASWGHAAVAASSHTGMSSTGLCAEHLLGRFCCPSFSSRCRMQQLHLCNTRRGASRAGAAVACQLHAWALHGAGTAAALGEETPLSPDPQLPTELGHGSRFVPFCVGACDEQLHQQSGCLPVHTRVTASGTRAMSVPHLV